jgi:hypothetical protein
MIDATTRRRLHVLTYGTAGPFMIFPFSQLDEVKALLERHNIYYWVDDNVISINGGPETVEINFGRNADAAAVQSILDSVE